jgi:hypothetical protein
MTGAVVLRIGTRADGDLWTGVLREGRKVIVSCGCRHHNRDQSTKASGRSARDCATSLVRAARFPDDAQRTRQATLRGPEDYLRTWQASAGTAERMRRAAAEAAEAFTARLPEVAALIGNRPVYGYAAHIAIAPVPPQGVTCRHCQAPIVPDRYAAERGWLGWRDENRSPDCPARGWRSHEPSTDA